MTLGTWGGTVPKVRRGGGGVMAPALFHLALVHTSTPYLPSVTWEPRVGRYLKLEGVLVVDRKDMKGVCGGGGGGGGSSGKLERGVLCSRWGGYQREGVGFQKVGEGRGVLCTGSG